MINKIDVMPGKWYKIKGDIPVSVYGKLKDLNIYVVCKGIYIGNEDILKEMIKRFGHPVRHFELEWGKYTGRKDEFLINGEEIIGTI